MKITIFTDDKKSWFIPYGKKLENMVSLDGHNTYYCFNKKAIEKGEVCFILSCTKILGNDILRLNKHNIVVHASNLPKGKGFSPLKWQIMENKKQIVLTLFEASEKVDDGPYYIREAIFFEGHELLPEMQEVMGNKIVDMARKYVRNYSTIVPHPLEGESTFYRKRTIKDDELDCSKSLEELFNNLRIADNERFPAYFIHSGRKYIIKIYKDV